MCKRHKSPDKAFILVSSIHNSFTMSTSVFSGFLEMSIHMMVCVSFENKIPFWQDITLFWMQSFILQEIHGVLLFVCVCVFGFVHFCVYVSGSNEAEDEADMKSIRRCQFGLILMLSWTPCITRTYTLKIWMHQACEYKHTHLFHLHTRSYTS